MSATSLDIISLKRESRSYLGRLSSVGSTALYGVSDGKAVGTYVEQRFHDHLSKKYTYRRGSAASGIDFPSLSVDLKVTSIRQPQSSCPYRDARQKVYGLGYHLLVFIYEKKDDHRHKIARMRFLHSILVHKSKTADYQTTRGLLEIIEREGNQDDVVAFLVERNLPLDEIGRQKLAEEILKTPPGRGFLTISNALQWRLQYGRIIETARQGRTAGVEELLIP